ncbi:neuroligin-4, Y-linked [Exaiptasia diaphana]|uniref:Carboxylic ester hydrolase n=1 Tax=Exaiptasia diaphana TaxID=2652724 RepID=A0A913YUI3_EXADI|nr:neuroligin-4, Y-linked [Exaiptasia diaphana]
MKTFGKVCWQDLNYTKLSPFNLPIKDMDEDCLNLNVYVPAAPCDSKRAVMVWIHGGGFLGGSNRIADGSYLATLGDVIVIAINFRRGILGYLHHRPSGLTGNYGLFDQLEALKWVNRNIAAFGGDPNRVTIFGNSAGGASVSLLCLSPLARNLFKYAIMQSGVANIPVNYQYFKEDPKSWESYKQRLKCNKNVSIIDCLKSAKPSFLNNVKLPRWLSPVIDGDFILDSPHTLLDKGNFTNPESTMIGVASDDGSRMTNAIPELSNPSTKIRGYSITRKYFLKFMNGWARRLNRLDKTFTRFLPFYKKAVIQEYTPWSNINKTRQNRRMILDFLTDSMFIAPSIDLANAFVKNGAKVFFYYVDHGIDMSDGYFKHPSFLKGYHESERFMVFGFPLKASHPPPADVAISKKVIEMWSNFAKTGYESV